jgi:hypothetical protein
MIVATNPNSDANTGLRASIMPAHIGAIGTLPNTVNSRARKALRNLGEDRLDVRILQPGMAVVAQKCVRVRNRFAHEDFD